MSEITRVFVTTSQRQLLWAMVQYDSINQVHAIVCDEIAAIDKTKKIVNHMDFLFEIRAALQAMPPQGGQVTLTEIARAYLMALLDNANGDRLEPELRAVFARDREDLRMKMGDLKSGFLLPYIKRLIGAS